MSDLVKVDPMVAKIEANPKYHALRRKRNVFGWSLTALMLVVYYGYIALIAFDKQFLAQPIGAGVTSLGIPIGLAVIIFTIVITGSPPRSLRRLRNEGWTEIPGGHGGPVGGSCGTSRWRRPRAS